MSSTLDTLGRPLGALRMSVTDRCNLRCNYCMPEDEYTWLPRESVLTVDEMTTLARAFASLGVSKIRLTGGEPLLRADLPQLVANIKRISSIRDVALTTNGLLLERSVDALRAAGLDRITVSLDTLHPARMAVFAKSSRHADVIAGIAAASRAGFVNTKLNAVVVRGYNDDEIVALAEFAHARELGMRYIEYMDVGGATRWNPESVVSRNEILDTLSKRFGAWEVVGRGADPNAPAERFRFASGLVVGIIASTTAPFCGSCDRARIAADGTFFLCLYGEQGIDLRGILRSGKSEAEVAAVICAVWQARTDTGAENRLAEADRGILVPLTRLRTDPWQEMHVRGG